MTNPEAEKVFQLLRNLLDAEYRRGEKDAIARIMKAAQGAPAATNGGVAAITSTERKERAPVGAADKLINRILTERGQRGATASEIHAAGISEDERKVSIAGIRFALKRGRDHKLYRNKSGKWFFSREKESAFHNAGHDAHGTRRSLS
jgi:hypothetical protein